MRLHLSKHPLSRPHLTLPMEQVTHDWFGQPQQPSPRYAMGLDAESFWLVASHEDRPRLHRSAKTGDFVEGLWEYDVAEWFVAAADGSSYLEFNLGPQGAWWCCGFDEARLRSEPALAPPAGVRTYAESTPQGAWTSAIAVPRAFLEEHVGFGPQSRMNVTMILGTPKERFLTAADLGGGEPDYHRPRQFRTADWISPNT